MMAFEETEAHGNLRYLAETMGLGNGSYLERIVAGYQALEKRETEALERALTAENALQERDERLALIHEHVLKQQEEARQALQESEERLRRHKQEEAAFYALHPELARLV
jgi:hypothetical protein